MVLWGLMGFNDFFFPSSLLLLIILHCTLALEKHCSSSLSQRLLSSSTYGLYACWLLMLQSLSPRSRSPRLRLHRSRVDCRSRTGQGLTHHLLQPMVVYLLQLWTVVAEVAWPRCCLTWLCASLSTLAWVAPIIKGPDLGRPEVARPQRSIVQCRSTPVALASCHVTWISIEGCSPRVSTRFIFSNVALTHNCLAKSEGRATMVVKRRWSPTVNIGALACACSGPRSSCLSPLQEDKQ